MRPHPTYVYIIYIYILKSKISLFYKFIPIEKPTTNEFSIGVKIKIWQNFELHSRARLHIYVVKKVQKFLIQTRTCFLFYILARKKNK